MNANVNIDSQKLDIMQKAVALGLLKDPQWLHKVNEPMPMWAVYDLLIQIVERIDPPTISYD